MVRDPSSERAALAGSEHPVFVALASNQGGVSNLSAAIDRLRAVAPIERISSVYQTHDLTSLVRQPFFNAAALLRSDLQPAGFKEELRRIEHELGRRRNGSEVAIDLDLCLFGSITCNGPGFRVPHPLLISRSYMTVPIAECNPQFEHPETGEPLGDLAERVLRTDTNTMIEKTDACL